GAVQVEVGRGDLGGELDVADGLLAADERRDGSGELERGVEALALARIEGQLDALRGLVEVKAARKREPELVVDRQQTADLSVQTKVVEPTAARDVQVDLGPAAALARDRSARRRTKPAADQRAQKLVVEAPALHVNPVVAPGLPGQGRVARVGADVDEQRDLEGDGEELLGPALELGVEQAAAVVERRADPDVAEGIAGQR